MSARLNTDAGYGSQAILRTAVLLISGLAALAAGTAASANGVVREQRPVASIERVVLRAVGDLYVTQGPQESLVIEAEKPLLGRISSHVKDGVLTFDIQGRQFSSRHPVRYHLTVKNLKVIDARGSGDIDARNLRGQVLDLHLAGSGNASVRALETQQLRVRIIGSAQVALDGRAAHQTVSIEGAGDYDARRLQSSQATVSISGAGNAVVHVKERLTARISGSGEIQYHGNPKVESAITGAGEVIRAEGAS